MSLRKSLLFSFLDRYASLVIGIVSSMLIARLLIPAEVGIFSLTMALTAFATTMRDFGAGQYLLQEKELTFDRIRAVWMVQMGLGLLLAVAVAACSVPVARFYAEPSIVPILLLIALSYGVNPLDSITYAWLMREMRYDAIALMRFTSSLCGAVVSVWMAAKHFGPISLAWGSFVSTLVNACMSTAFCPRGYPWLPEWREVPRVLSFGSRFTSATFITTATQSTPGFLLDKLQSLAAVGFYSRTNGLVSMFFRLVTDAGRSVALSLFAKEAREARDSSASFVHAMAWILVLSWSFAATLALLAYPLVRALYGPQWVASVELTRLLAVTMAFAAPVPICRVALLGVGEVKGTLRATARSAAVTIVVAATGVNLSLRALGLCMIAASAISIAFWLSETRRAIVYRWQNLGMAAGQSAVAALVSAAGPAAAFLLFPPQPDVVLPALLLDLPGATIGLLLGLYLARHPLSAELRRLMLDDVKRFHRRLPTGASRQGDGSAPAPQPLGRSGRH